MSSIVGVGGVARGGEREGGGFGRRVIGKGDYEGD